MFTLYKIYKYGVVLGFVLQLPADPTTNPIQFFYNYYDALSTLNDVSSY